MQHATKSYQTANISMLIWGNSSCNVGVLTSEIQSRTEDFSRINEWASAIFKKMTYKISIFFLFLTVRHIFICISLWRNCKQKQDWFYLKSKDVQNSQRSVAVPLCSTDDIVNSLHKPGKEATVQSFSYCIPEKFTIYTHYHNNHLSIIS